MKAIWDLQDNIKQVNLHIIGIPEGEEKKKWIENIFEQIITQKFPNIKDADIKKQESQNFPHMLNPNRPTQRHIIIKVANVKAKEKIVKAARERQSINYKGTCIMLSADFHTEIL